MSRQDKIKNLTESFTYDNLNRLTGSHVAGQDAINISYENNGNIFSKSDVGEDDYIYNYGENGAGLHAVTSIYHDSGLPSKFPVLQQDITYTSFNKIEDIIQGENEMQFTYGTDNLRRKTQLYNDGELIKTKYYVGNYEKEISGSNTRELHYIYGGDGLAAVYIKQGTTTNMYYVSKNYLGSPIILTKEDGTIAEQYSFDAWGNRRNPTNWSYSNVPTSYLLDRGFTFHEHMDEFGLINMNGRLYDPEIARMLSPDNNVQMPDFTQNFNRYSYCLNNPLKFTDPTGYTAYYAEDVLGRRDGSGGGINDAYSWGFWEPGDPHLSEIYGLDAQANSYFSWSNLYNSGLTTTGFSEYLSRGGVCDLNGSGVTTYYGQDAIDYFKYGHTFSGSWDGSGVVQFLGETGGGTYTIGGQDGGDGINSGDIIPFESGMKLKYDLHDGVGIRSSAAASGYISFIDGQITVSAQVLHGENFIDYNYVANARLRVNNEEVGFYSLTRNGSESVYNSIYNYIGNATFLVPQTTGTIYLDVNIGYWVNNNGSHFNGTYFNQTYIIRP